MDFEKIVSIAELAGDAILEIYDKPETMNIQHKGDNSPLTAADLAAHNIIVRELRKIDNTPIVSYNFSKFLIRPILFPSNKPTEPPEIL